MIDIRRTVLWVIFAFSLVLLWDKWQIHNGNKPLFAPSPAVTPAVTAAPSLPGGTTPANPSPANTANTPTNASALAANGLARERIDIDTDVFKLTFDGEGGSLVKADLSQFKDKSNDQGLVDHLKSLVMPSSFPPPVDKLGFNLMDDTAKHYYVAQTGLIGAGMPDHKTVMRWVPGERSLKDGENELKVRFESPDMGGVKLVKTYTLRRGAYDIAVEHEVINTGNAAVTPQLYVQLVRDGQKFSNDPAFPSSFNGAAVYTEDKKYQKSDFSDIKKNKAEFEKQATTGYVAMAQHYFASAWWFPAGVAHENFMDAKDVGVQTPDCCYRVGMVTTLPAVAPGSSQKSSAQLYVGPEEGKVLEALTPGLDLVKDYGHLTILAKPLYWLLDQLHGYLGNWGWSIVALVVLLKIAFYWLNAKAYGSMAKMKAINPKITEMRERLKDKPQQMQQEMMRIYREEKVNPMGGCLPIVIQIPVFIALYTVLSSSVEMSNAPWIGWIKDLSSYDPYLILPFLMTCSSLLQTWLNPTPPDPIQAKMMWIMPLAFSFMFFSFPAGLVLYWLTNNLLSIAQQWVINRRLGVK